MEEPGLSSQRMALGGRGQAATGRSIREPDLGGRRRAGVGGGMAQAHRGRNTTWGKALECLSGSCWGKSVFEVPHLLAAYFICLEIQMTES